MKMRKVFDRKGVISWSNSEDAKEYVEQPGYFGNSFQELITNVNNDSTSILWNVFGADEVHCVFEDANGIRSGLFLPMDKVKEVKEEKKWRAFKSIDEFKNETGLDLLHIVHYRLSPSRSITSTGYGVITEFNTSGSDKTDYITIGDTSFNLNELFNYEYLDDNEWKPFGVLE